MKRTYEVASATDKRAMAEFMKREGQFLLPMVELVERTELAIDEVIQVMGRATIEAVLEMSAEGVAGPKQSGKAREEGSTVWYGRQNGLVYLSDRKIRIERPRLRERNGGQGGEVEVPAYAAMRRPGAMADRMLDGIQKLEQLARWLERDHPSAAASLREGLREMFTINRLGLPPRLRKCLGTTNVIDSTHSGVRQKTRRVTHWKNGAMALRWAAASFVETAKSYQRIVGFDQLWMLKAHLDDHEPVAEMKMAG